MQQTGRQNNQVNNIIAVASPCMGMVGAVVSACCRVHGGEVGIAFKSEAIPGIQWLLGDAVGGENAKRLGRWPEANHLTIVKWGIRLGGRVKSHRRRIFARSISAGVTLLFIVG